MLESWPWNLAPCLLGPYPGYHTADKFFIINHLFLIPFIIILITEGINAHCRNSNINSPPTLCHYLWNDVFPSRHFSVPSLYKNGIRPHIILCTEFFCVMSGEHYCMALDIVPENYGNLCCRCTIIPGKFH